MLFVFLFLSVCVSVCLSLSLSVSSGVVLSPVHCAMLCVGVVGSSDVQPGIVVAPSDTVAVHGVDEVVQFECVVNARSAHLQSFYRLSLLTACMSCIIKVLLLLLLLLLIEHLYSALS